MENNHQAANAMMANIGAAQTKGVDMRKIIILASVFLAFTGQAIAGVPTVNPERHSGGIAQQKNNRVFEPSNNVAPITNKLRNPGDDDIARQAAYLAAHNATTSILLIEKGQIVFEQYNSPATADSPLFSQSMSKSLTAMAIGNALCNGKIGSLDDRADNYAKDLVGTVQGEASIKNLLAMSSGNRDGQFSGEQYETEWEDLAFGKISTVDIIKKYGIRDTTALGIPLRSGEDFRYNASDTYALSLVLNGAGGFFETFEKYVWQNAGTEKKGYWLRDNIGNPQAASGASATGRDWARLGMYSIEQLKRGSACMQAFMKEATSPQIKNKSKRVGQAFGSYGYQTWIADFSGKHSYWWVGYGGQRVGIEPESEKIIVLTSWKEDYMGDVYKLFGKWIK